MTHLRISVGGDTEKDDPEESETPTAARTRRRFVFILGASCLGSTEFHCGLILDFRPIPTDCAAGLHVVFLSSEAH